jgi:hypothetical protein
MPNSKISALPAASTPLAGAELVPVVQGGITEQVSVTNLTAGRAVSAASYAVTGSTAPANGMYLYAANSLGWSVASTQALWLNSTGLGVGLAPNYSITSYKGGAVANYIQVASGATGAGAGNGLLVGVDASGNGAITAQGAVSLNINVAGLETFNLDSSNNAKVSRGNLIIGTSAKGITNSTGSVALNFSTAGTSLNSAQSVLTNSFNNVGTAQTITIADYNGGYVVITGVQGGVGSSTWTLPFVKRAGSIAIGTATKAILTADPILTVATSGGNIAVTPLAANTYITYAIYYTPLGA